jgi:hypothetical protein
MRFFYYVCNPNRNIPYINKKIKIVMEIIIEKDFEFFKQMMRENRETAILGLKTNSINPYRVIKVETDKWRAIINESFALTKTKKIYLKRTKTTEVIIGEKFIYNKSKQGLKTVSPFSYASGIESLMTKKEVFEFYGLDFLFKYANCFDNRTTISKIRKNKITNIEQLFKLTYPYIPYNFFRKNNTEFNIDSSFLNNLNNMLSVAKNPNVITNLKKGDIDKMLYATNYSDTVNMTIQLGRKINLLWSPARIKEEHDKLTKELSGIKKMFVRHEDLKPSKVFKNILPEEFELIDDRYRLFEEGEMMGHCVYTSDTYINNIKEGTGAIYSILYEGKRYTLELIYNSFSSDKKYYINQFRAASNQNPPENLNTWVHELIFRLNFNKPTKTVQSMSVDIEEEVYLKEEEIYVDLAF